MDLIFEKVNGKWVAEFEATSEFNLHVEREQSGTLIVYQSGVKDSQYDVAFIKDLDTIVDYDFGALIYPKWIKVTSGSKVLSATVTFG